MDDTDQPSTDHTSNLKIKRSEFKTPSPTANSSCVPRCCRQALASIDRNTPVSNLKMEHSAFKTPSPANSCCTPRHRRRQALASLDRNTPVNPPSSSTTTKAKHLQTPRTKSPSNKKKGEEKENQYDHSIPCPVLFISPPALERLQHDLTDRRRPFGDSEGDEYYARRRANVSRMRESREKARRLAKNIRKTRREVDEGIQRLCGGRPERIQKGVAGFGISDS